VTPEMNTVPLHAVREGRADGPTVVFGGSLASNLSMWEPILPRFTGSFDVVRYDLRGHGSSPVPAGPYEIADLGADLLALLDRLSIQRAHLVGLSLGGMAAMWAAAHAPDRVDRLVLCCTSAQLGPPEMWAERAALARTGGTAAGADAAIGRWFTPAFAAREPELVARTKAMIAATPDQGYIECCGAIERMDLRPMLGSITAPTLVVAGEHDPATPVDHAELIAGLIPDARLAVVASAAHLAVAEQPDETGKLIATHLEGG
jgi:3-oxoadipate enol-lactonase